MPGLYDFCNNIRLKISWCSSVLINTMLQSTSFLIWTVISHWWKSTRAEPCMEFLCLLKHCCIKEEHGVPQRQGCNKQLQIFRCKSLAWVAIVSMKHETLTPMLAILLVRFVFIYASLKWWYSDVLLLQID